MEIRVKKLTKNSCPSQVEMVRLDGEGKGSMRSEPGIESLYIERELCVSEFFHTPHPPPRVQARAAWTGFADPLRDWIE